MDDNRSKNKISLDILIEEYVIKRMDFNNQDGEVASSQNLENPAEGDCVAQAAKDHIREQIIKEVKQDLTKKEIQEIKDNAQKAYQKSKIKEKHQMLKATLTQGIFLAFLVGLLVNQVTNWIAKGTNETLGWTIGLSLVFFFMIAILFIYMLGSELLKLWDEGEED